MIYSLSCHAAAPPDDRWLSIAETFEFLRERATDPIPASPVLGSGRIARPVEGFAVTFPDDRTVEEVTPETQVLLFDESPDDGVLFTTVLWADQPDSPLGFCLIVDVTGLAQALPRWTTVETVTTGFAALYEEARPGSDEPENDFPDLPAGRTGHFTLTSTPGWTRGVYLFGGAGTWSFLECASPEPPDDGWLSIAETYESLPAEQRAESSFPRPRRADLAHARRSPVREPGPLEAGTRSAAPRRRLPGIPIPHWRARPCGCSSPSS